MRGMFRWKVWLGNNNILGCDVSKLLTSLAVVREWSSGEMSLVKHYNLVPAFLQVCSRIAAGELETADRWDNSCHKSCNYINSLHQPRLLPAGQRFSYKTNIFLSNWSLITFFVFIIKTFLSWDKDITYMTDWGVRCEVWGVGWGYLTVRAGGPSTGLTIAGAVKVPGERCMESNQVERERERERDNHLNPLLSSPPRGDQIRWG